MGWTSGHVEKSKMVDLSTFVSLEPMRNVKVWDEAISRKNGAFVKRIHISDKLVANSRNYYAYGSIGPHTMLLL